MSIDEKIELYKHYLCQLIPGLDMNANGRMFLEVMGEIKGVNLRLDELITAANPPKPLAKRTVTK